MDRALPPESAQSAIEEVLGSAYRPEGVAFHAVRMRQAGLPSLFFHLSSRAAPGSTGSVWQGTSCSNGVERDLRDAVPGATVFTHLEPIDDPGAFAHTSLGREQAGDRGV